MTNQKQTQLLFSDISKRLWFVFYQEENCDNHFRIFFKHKYPFPILKHNCVHQSFTNFNTNYGGISNKRKTQLLFSRISRRFLFSYQDENCDSYFRIFFKHRYPFPIFNQKGVINFMQTAQPNLWLPGQLTLRKNQNLLGHKSSFNLMENN